MTEFNQPVDAALVPRFAGHSTFMRLPVVETAAGQDVALIGVPFDGGTTNRAGARHGPREIRNQSSLMRRYNHATQISPYDVLQVADLGDCPVNPIDLRDALRRIEGFFAEVVAAGAVPLTAGGDHLITSPILRAVGKAAPVGLIHFDAHSDTNDTYFGDNPYTHGSPFRRAIEDGVLDPRRMVQIGLRGSLYTADDHAWARAQGIRQIYVEEFVSRGVDAVMDEALEIAGSGPTYVSFDIDSIDPSMAVGTGTPEIGGFTTREAQFMLRRLGSVRIVGADVVEVAPAYDQSEITAIAAAHIACDLLCLWRQRKVAER